MNHSIADFTEELILSIGSFDLIKYRFLDFFKVIVFHYINCEAMPKIINLPIGKPVKSNEFFQKVYGFYVHELRKLMKVLVFSKVAVASL